jgi:alkaline phosphatase D
MGARVVRDDHRRHRLGGVLPQGHAIARALSRRGFLLRATALGAASFLALPRARAARMRFAEDPFSLGVASGAPRTTSVLLWTRLAPLPLQEGGTEAAACDVRWEVAADERFRRIVREGETLATPERAHAVHVEVPGLEAGREYHYRFFAGGIASPTGRTRTSPAPGRGDERLRLAFASCQQYEQGYFGAHRHLADEGVDAVAFLGDYIYESSWGREHVRKHGTGEPRTLAEYRNRYALYKADRDLQASHAAAPWIVIWDDHEVANDYADDRSQDLDPDFLARRAAAYQAFLEHMPLRPSAILAGGGLRIYDRYEWGGLATIHALDDRQYRAHQVCPRPNRGGSTVVGDECAARLEPSRTMLGEAQERWLDAGFAAAGTRWNVIAQQTLFASAGHDNKNGKRVYWTDGWDGYPAARDRLIGSLVEHKVANPVVIGGDVHATYVADVRARAGDPGSPVVAAEFCGTSITSQGKQPEAEAIRSANPDVRYAEARRRGYTVLEISRDRTEARLRCVDSVKQREMTIATTESFTVLAGRPGLQK